MEVVHGHAVLFGELLGAAELYARVGDAAASAAIANCAGLLNHAAASCDARHIKTSGSRVMLIASSADAAAGAASAMQSAAADFRLGAATHQLSLGVGMHVGPLIRENNDVFGDTVNLAARLVEQAAPGQILFAAETAESMTAAYKRLVRRLYSMPLKGRSEDVALCELAWRGDGGATFVPPGAMNASTARLTLKYRGIEIVLEQGLRALTIGREPDCSLVLDNAEASRHHCTIERRGDHFVLIDRSTNGTYVTIEREEEVRLKRDDIMLRKRGWISFSKPRGEGGEAVEFVCE